MIREFMNHAGALVLLGMALELLAAVAAGLAILALRFFRRGAARFGVAPALAGLALLPLAVGAGTTLLAYRNTLDGLALTGSGGAAALAGGSAESLVPLLLGLLASAGLALAALLVTVVGTSRAPADAAGRGLALPLLALLVVACCGPLVLLLAGLVTAPNAGLLDPRALSFLLWLGAGATAVLSLVVLLLPLAATIGAPRGAPSLGVKGIGVAALALAGAGAVIGSFVVWREMRTLGDAALTGEPYEGAFGAAARDLAVSFGATAVPRPLVVSLAHDGTYRIAMREVARESLRATLAAAHDGGPPKLALRADDGTPFAAVIPALEAAEAAGWTTLQLMRPGHPGQVAIGYDPGEAERERHLLFVSVGDTIELNRNPIADLSALDALLRDVLSTRRWKTVFVVPQPDTAFGLLATFVETIRDAGAEPVVLVTPARAAALPPPPPPPPPPPAR
jgi:biopolymer transport protein ExbD